MTGVTMPYVKPSVNIAVHIVKSINDLELLKLAKRDVDVIVCDKTMRVKMQSQGDEAVSRDKLEVRIERHVSTLEQKRG
jgi:hypothetical protein